MCVILLSVDHEIGSQKIYSSPELRVLRVPCNFLLYLNSEAIFLPCPIKIVVYCMIFKNQIDILTISSQSNLKTWNQINLISFHILVIHLLECFLVFSSILRSLNLFCVPDLYPISKFF